MDKLTSHIRIYHERKISSEDHRFISRGLPSDDKQ